jgi:hypothetical protein
MRRYVVRVALDQRVDMVLCDAFIALLALQETKSALYILSNTNDEGEAATASVSLLPLWFASSPIPERSVLADP